ncbi:MAG: DUF3500 domain-containing protein [Planctomycetia bacterium]|nr:DUF3500 domain-containing protein [Planctomycetia bacterium]
MLRRSSSLSRRGLLAATAAAVPALVAGGPRPVRGSETAASAETLAQALHASLTASQREAICFPWDYRHPKFGLLRTRVANNWNATKPAVKSDFFTADQQRMVRDIFERLVSPDWLERFDKQLEDDTGGFGHEQSIALIGEPASGRFQFLLSGRHMTLRCDGDSAEHVAFGGPIFYGHDAGGFNEEKNHAGNVFWPQALAVNGVYGMLDGRQRNRALVPKAPRENAIAFRGAEAGDGLPVRELDRDQRAELERVLALLLEPFRTTDREEARRCLAAQGGLEGCRLAFYRDDDLGNDGVWDNWRLEGPAFVWHFRGAPHVHVWVNIADTANVPTNA